MWKCGRGGCVGMVDAWGRRVRERGGCVGRYVRQRGVGGKVWERGGVRWVC